jgi:hypothetical protein
MGLVVLGSNGKGQGFSLLSNHSVAPATAQKHCLGAVAGAGRQNRRAK